MKEIKFFGRGGQGVVMASQVLGLGYFKAGMYPQCYSLFGGERRGAPVVGFLRVDNEKIFLKCDIKQADMLLYFDPILIDFKEIRCLLRPEGQILINTDQSVSSFKNLSEYRLGLIDASVIAKELGLGHMINTAILGAYCCFSNHLSMEHLISAVEEMVPAKKEANVAAVHQGYSKLIMNKGEN